MSTEEPNAKPKENARLLPRNESQEATADDEHFFHPVQLSDKTEEDPDEKDAENEQKLQELLKNMSEETVQLNAFMTEESKLMNELCTSLKQILKTIHVSVNIQPEDIPLKKKIKEVTLSQNGDLILISEKDEKHSAFLAEYPPEIVMAVLWVVIPELAKVITMYKKRTGVRVNFFGRVKKELKNAAKALGSIGEETPSSDKEKSEETQKEAPKGESKEDDRWC